MRQPFLRPNASSRRGSALIMVVTALVIMALLGVAYIQIAKLDRIATAQITGGNVDSVIGATLSLISARLGDDLHNGTNHFEQGADTNPAASEPYIPRMPDEPFDYPFTGPSPASPWTAKRTTDASPQNVRGGANDDAFLAPSAPLFDDPAPGDMKWVHLTNLMGIWLSIPDASGALTPTEYLITNNTPDSDNSDTDQSYAYLSGAVANALTHGFDTDFDGILDSRWTWAPIRQIGNVQYVMAVRIIDNSAMLNANVATSLVDGSGNYVAGAHVPRWWYPSEIDLGGFVSSFTDENATRMNELQQLLNYRLGSNALPSTWGTASGDRPHFWLNGPSLYGAYASPYRALSIADELVMRYRNGLVNPTAAPVFESATDGLRVFFRGGAVEADYTSFVATLSSPGAPGIPQMRSYYEREARHQTTLFSGSSIYAPRLPDFPGVVNRAGAPLNPANDPAVPLRVDVNLSTAEELAEAIQRVYETHNGGVAAVVPGNPADGPELFANQFAASIKDYADTDNHLTSVGAGALQRWGMEALPFVVEVYAQAYYQVTVAAPNATTTTAWDVTWTQQGTTGYAIEIRNPFRREISLEDVNLWVGGADWGDLATLAGQTTLAVDEVLVLYRDGTGGAAADDSVANLINAAFTKTAITQNWPAGNAAITVELRAQDSAGAALTWAYNKVDSVQMEASYTETSVGDGQPDPSAAPVASGYRIRGRIGNGNGLNMIGVVGAGAGNTFTQTTQDPTLPAAAPLRDTTQNGLSRVDKTTGGPPNGPASIGTLHQEQLVIADHAGDTIKHVGEVAHIASIGPDATATVNERWGAQTSAAVFLLNFAATETVGANTSQMAIPHAAALLGRLTTMSPVNDTADNDGDGAADNPEELFVPGTINLNTVPIPAADAAIPGSFLDRVLPITDATLRAAVIKAIRDYRDDAPGGRPGGYRAGMKGIASMGELYNVLAPLMAGPEGDAGTIGGLQTDFIPATGADDGIANDREELMTLAKWLQQTCTVRSDIFTAYITIQGYPAGNFPSGPVESARLIAVFDRSGVSDPSKPVKVLGVYQYP